jgi:transposase-like protein
MSTPVCPHCDQSQFVVKEPVMLLSMPPKQEYFCKQCNYSWHEVAEAYEAREAEDEGES